MTYDRVCNKSNTTVATCVAVIANLPEHLSSPPAFSGVRVARSLVFCLMFCISLLVLLSFSFGHCVVCPSFIWFTASDRPLASSNSSYLCHLEGTSLYRNLVHLSRKAVRLLCEENQTHDSQLRMEVYESTEGNVTVLILKKDCIHNEPLMSNILFGVVADGPLHGKHFLTILIPFHICSICINRLSIFWSNSQWGSVRFSIIYYIFILHTVSYYKRLL